MRAPSKSRSRGRRARPRALVTDVDGTLTDAQRRLDLRAVRAIRGLVARRVPVILATGNVLPIALALHRSIGLNGPIVAENGGIIYEKRGPEERVSRLCRREVATKALRRARRAGLDVRPLFTDRWRETEVGLEPSVSVARLRRVLAREPVNVESTGYAIHLMEKGAGKARALRRVLRPLGLALSDCVVAGDGDNDVEMLRATEWSISFPTASPAARRAARIVARAPYAEGFVEALMRLRVVRRRPE